ncbi:MAG TPA: Zn-dependent alcohol dehydrogenase [Methylomirabilota bacterium]|jgi:S-(hydroxymethyl)glutathione dehydrogenase/alcohol dehydrogenase|nr:Zn-dependent alcohol dehydrogenase [Methylomirabilota bacterium]
MRASVLFEQRTPLKVEDVELQAPRAGEVRVRMAASGVCHSCLHAADGSWKNVPVPIVLGDEGAGVVEAVGPEVHTLKPGDHVILSWAPTCGRCHYCVIGRPNLCAERRPGQGVLLDGTTRMALGGRPVYQYGHVATYASVTVVHESSAIAIDKTVPLDRAALIGCSVMTGVGAVINTAVVPPGASMAVFGVGGVGLNAVQGGAMVAAQPIIAVDVRGAKLDQARALGATHAIDASKEDPVAEIRRITKRGADFTFVAVGDTRAVGQAAEALAPGGTCVVIGVPATGATVPLDVRPLVTGERVIRGSSYGGARTREDLPRLVELYRAGKLKIDELISKRYGLDEANEAFRALAAGELARGLIVF